jgi:hypothetical protein
MNLERIENYNSHAKLLADIALAILHGNKNVLDINGIKEIIALYLLIPYITPNTLTTPSVECKIPKIEGLFYNDIKLEDLRNSLCHSFVTVEEDVNDGSVHGKRLILDDRALYSNRNNHEKLGYHSSAVNVPIEYAHDKLVELFNKINEM